MKKLALMLLIFTLVQMVSCSRGIIETEEELTSLKLERIEITPYLNKLPVGVVHNFKAIGIYENFSTKDITSSVEWRTSDSSVLKPYIGGKSGQLESESDGNVFVSASADGVTGYSQIIIEDTDIDSLSMEPLGKEIPEGESEKMDVIGVFDNGMVHDVSEKSSWSSSDITILKVSNQIGAKGLAETLTAGTATITAVYDSLSVNSPIEVSNETLTRIEVSPASFSLPKKGNENLKVTAVYSDNSTKDVTEQSNWSTDNPSTAKVDSGKVEAIEEGITNIHASFLSSTASSEITVTEATVASIAISPLSSSIPPGVTTEFTATATMSDNSTKDITNSVIWKSDDQEIISISNDTNNKGFAYGHSSGSANIEASFLELQTSTDITVSSATLTSIDITPSSNSIGLLARETLTATGTYSDATTKDITDLVTWTTSDDTVALVSNSNLLRGEVFSLALGSATITAELDGQSDNASVTVTNKTLSSISVTAASTNVPLGSSTQLTAIATYSDASTSDITASVLWSVDDTNLASISNSSSSEGELISLNIGSLVVTASFEGVSDTVSINTTAAELVSMVVSSVDANVALGLSTQFTAIGTYTNASTADITTSVTWSVNNGALASISNAGGTEGRLLSIAIGTPVITATLGSVSDDLSINTTAAELVSISITPSTSTVSVLGILQLTATGTYTNSTTADLSSVVTWTSSNLGLVAFVGVAFPGRIRCISLGSVTITATLGAISGTATVN